jgi:hypothetical protein
MIGIRFSHARGYPLSIEETTTLAKLLGSEPKDPGQFRQSIHVGITLFVQSVIETRGRRWRPNDAMRNVLELAGKGPREAVEQFLAAKRAELPAHKGAATVAFRSGTNFPQLDLNGLETEEAAVAIIDALENVVAEGRTLLLEAGAAQRGPKPDTELAIYVGGLIDAALEVGANLKAPTNWGDEYGYESLPVVKYVRHAIELATGRVRQVLLHRNNLSKSDRQTIVARIAELERLTDRAIGERAWNSISDHRRLIPPTSSK